MDSCPKANCPTPTLTSQWGRAFIGEWRGLHAETAQSILTVIFKLVIWWQMISIVLIVLNIVDLCVQGRCLPTSLTPALGIVAAYIVTTV